MKTNPEDDLTELLRAIAQHVGFAHTRLFNHGVDPGSETHMIETAWISRMTDLLVCYGDADDEVAYPPGWTTILSKPTASE